MLRFDLTGRLPELAALGVMIDKAAFFLHPPGFFVAVEIAAPYARRAERPKAALQQTADGLRHESASPELPGDPIAELQLILPCAVGTAAEGADAPDGTACLFQHERIGLRRRKDRFDDVPAVLHACVRRPAGGRTNGRVSGVFIKILRVLRAPGAQKEARGLQLDLHKASPWNF